MSRGRRAQAETIVQLTEIAWTLAQRDLAARNAVEREAVARLAALRADERQAVEAAMATADVGMRLALERWSGWAQERAAALNIVIARSRAETARERDAARQALARRDAARALRDQIAAEARRARQKKDALS